MLVGEAVEAGGASARASREAANLWMLVAGLVLFLGFAYSFYSDLSRTVGGGGPTEVFQDTRF